jgi:hypothetical protein
VRSLKWKNAHPSLYAIIACQVFVTRGFAGRFASFIIGAMYMHLNCHVGSTHSTVLDFFQGQWKRTMTVRYADAPQWNEELTFQVHEPNRKPFLFFFELACRKYLRRCLCLSAAKYANVGAQVAVLGG